LILDECIMKLIINYERLSKILIRRIVSLYGESKMIGELSGIFQDKKSCRSSLKNVLMM